jgi:transcriptional regulator with GAF, ATPase, and Fis domain
MLTHTAAAQITRPVLPMSRPSRAPEIALLGESEAFRSVLQQVDLVAPTDATVLLLGETGTGKGLVAHALHRQSPRRSGRFVDVNCAALPATLIESELFGRERGAFTDATVSQPGRFELAHGGTIFLDEIGELPLDIQAKLLRVLQEGTLERLGSPRTIRVDVRVIAATNRNIHEEVRAGRFRQDLFYRLNVFPISSPPLRSRMSDVPMLTNHFVAEFSRRYGKCIHTIPPSVLEQLQAYDWPGNIRELEHVIERAVITSTDGILYLIEPLISTNVGAPAPASATRLVDLERLHIERILGNTAWRIEGPSGAATKLGLHPSTLRSRMIKLGIRRPEEVGTARREA